MNIFSPFLKIQNQLKIYHWQTQSYSQHKAFGSAYEELDGLIDSFVECYIGRYGYSQVHMVFKMELNSYDENYNKFVDDCILYLTNLSNEIDEISSDLLNIRDEMIAVFTRLKYLLSMK